MTTATRWTRFAVVSAGGFVVQIAIVGALTAWLGVPPPAATAAGVAAALLHNFVWHARWTWADRRAARSHAIRALARFASANGAVSLAGNVALVSLAASATPAGAVAANAAAVAVCSLVNFWCGDRVVFRAPHALEQRIFRPACAPTPRTRRSGSTGSVK